LNSLRIKQWFLYLLLAGIGYFLVTIPGRVISDYKGFYDFNQPLAKFYLVSISFGGFCMVVVFLRVLFLIIRNTRLKRTIENSENKPVDQMSRKEKTDTIDQRVNEAEGLIEQGGEQISSSELQDDLMEIREKMESEQFEIVVFGTVSSGKSSLLNALAGCDVFSSDLKGGSTLRREAVPWPDMKNTLLVDTPGLGEVGDRDHALCARKEVGNADIILFVIDGALKQFEFDVLREIGVIDKRILICLNKKDWLNENNQKKLVAQITDQVSRWISKEDILVVQSSKTMRKRIRLLPDDVEQEEEVEIPADLSSLARRLLRIINKEGKDLLLANLLLRSRVLIADVKTEIHVILRSKAKECVNQYTWKASVAAAVCPLPVVDLVAGMAIIVKMVMEIAAIYQQRIDVKTVEELIGELGKNMAATLGVTALTPVVSSSVGSTLKTIPGAGTLAGGILQGLTQAFIAQWIGRVFIQYFAEEMNASMGELTRNAKSQWEVLTKPEELSSLVKIGLKHIAPASLSKRNP
jgi:hypothetical protein